LAQDVERLHQGHSGLEQRRELLIKDQELARRNSVATRKLEGTEGRPSRPLNAADVQALLFEFAPEARFVFGDVDPFDDLPAGCTEPAAELHRLMTQDPRVRARSCLCWHYRPIYRQI